PLEIQTLQAVQQERDLLRLERDLLRREREAAQLREQAALEREREAREERQAAREREALLLRMVEQTQQRYDRLLDMLRPLPSQTPRRPVTCPQHPGPRRQGPPQRQAGAFPAGSHGETRRRIVTLLQDHPEGLTHDEMQRLLGVDKNLSDTLIGMLRYALVW